jgi:hypothetical protein
MTPLAEFMHRVCLDDDLQLRFLVAPIATLKAESVDIDEATTRHLSDALQGPQFENQDHQSSLAKLGITVGRTSKER